MKLLPLIIRIIIYEKLNTQIGFRLPAFNDSLLIDQLINIGQII